MSIPGFTAEAAIVNRGLEHRQSPRPMDKLEVIPQGLGCGICVAGCVLCLANPELYPVCLEACAACVLYWC
jgi:hypothetical protein